MPVASQRIIVAFLLVLNVLAFPSYSDKAIHLDPRQDEKYAGTPIEFPPRMAFTGAKRIPDAAHPFIAPRPNDLRGPCPGLNTLANHGYLPRNGIATVAQLTQASQEGFNLGYDFARAVSSLAVLTRGNPFLNLVSIGGASPRLIPPLPGAIDGTPGGLSKHGRFEGDVSMTRRDAALGDPGALDIGMLDDFLSYVDRLGDGDVVTQSVLNEYRFHRFQDSLARNPKLVYQVGRHGFSYGEGGFILNLFADGITHNTTRRTFDSFLRTERFPPSWNRRAAPFEFPDIINAAEAIISAHPVPPGKKNAGGTYVPDTDPRLDFPCGLYYNLVGMGVPAVLLNTTGLLRKNVDKLLMEGIHPLFADVCPEPVIPEGPAGV
ncbi:Chloroperoxidase [Pterulicium gracile]|uniref:Chloroperoxidase n=1 Tax=Pterulicium gracile TaxID=1884261 RepID=A0A5C3QI62_9AGAR|nr:Chloroperoxidase [Pterula gracilis]